MREEQHTGQRNSGANEVFPLPWLTLLTLKGTQLRIFLAPNLNFALFHC
jgi:hypothetical protein